ncbi:DUF1003 domain-containing protein [Hansschlegelia zhihuaiae]|uniref:DUF1003 domain-containing protein n=1 Tax=Hansschlegelia zhihuaiae TaxID=405005 RepID=A0A4Q0MJC2_9HYPH|nr:DUF1003 domain-containing protein [Hansschlegelia zhihuaiae]RXF73189.1 DUF1003 domain-containing protein [Hansschlegelia zhihuaiae]
MKASDCPPDDEHASFVTAAAHRWFGGHPRTLREAETRVLRHAAARRVITRHPDHGADELTFGQKLADRVAAVGGSWGFIIGFGASLLCWTGLNVLALARPFDPYPFIFLNLLLSMLAAIQAPVIMMSQNRQAAKDRQNAALDYEVNLKAEIEIMGLHDKLDRMRDEHLVALLKKQQEQIELLTRIASGADGSSARTSEASAA